MSDTGAAPPRPQHVRVYGNDHSPFVQAVLLGLHERRIPHTQVLAPPLAVFRHSGILMPAARSDDGEWQLDSERILVGLGYPEVAAEDRRTIQTVFIGAALHRTDHAWRFWQRFSTARDGHPALARRVWSQFWRSFATLYFHTLITLARRRPERPTLEDAVRELSRLQERLGSGADFLGGEAPDTLDLQLFGIVQMCSSIPGLPLERLQRDPKLELLRAWISRMQQRFADYTHLYSARDFEPRLPPIRPAAPLERLGYWCGAASMGLALPLTLPTALYLIQRTRRRRLVR